MDNTEFFNEDTNGDYSPPMEEIFAVKVGKKLRIYKNRGLARGQVTRTLGDTSNPEASFQEDVELWSVGQNGWLLEFSALAGQPHGRIDWKNAVQRNIIRKARCKEQAIKREEDHARQEYERLKARFEDK